MFIEALFTLAKRWRKQPKCSYKDQWINKIGPNKIATQGLGAVGESVLGDWMPLPS